MGELWVIEVLGVDKVEKTVQMRVTKVHPDAGPHLTTKTFALALLIDLYWRHSKGYSTLPSLAKKSSSYAEGSDATAAAASAHPARQEMQRLVGVHQGIEVELTQQEYESEALRKERYPHMSCYGKSTKMEGEVEVPRHYGVISPNPADFQAEAEALVTGVDWTLDDECSPNNNAKQSEGDEEEERWQTHGVLVVRLQSGELLHLVEEGQSFESASYY